MLSVFHILTHLMSIILGFLGGSGVKNPPVMNVHNNSMRQYYYHLHFTHEISFIETKRLAQGHTANVWKEEDSNPGSLAPSQLGVGPVTHQ